TNKRADTYRLGRDSPIGLIEVRGSMPRKRSGRMGRRYMLWCSLACASCLALAQSAWAGPTFKPRIGGAMGLIPPITATRYLNSLAAAPVVRSTVTYHAGQVMAGGIAAHVIFWGPSGSFHGSPRHGVPTFKGLIEQSFTDVA